MNITFATQGNGEKLRMRLGAQNEIEPKSPGSHWDDFSLVQSLPRLMP